jgi:hypothetical protein
MRDAKSHCSCSLVRDSSHKGTQQSLDPGDEAASGSADEINDHIMEFSPFATNVQLVRFMENAESRTDGTREEHQLNGLDPQRR